MNAPRDGMTRHELAEFLTDKGFPVKPQTLANAAVRGTGPEPDGYWGRQPFYNPVKGLRWAKSRFRKNRPSGVRQAVQATG